MIPLILGAAALGTATFGLFKGAEGALDILSAKERGERAQATYQASLNSLELERDEINEQVDEYGQLKLWMQALQYVDLLIS